MTTTPHSLGSPWVRDQLSLRATPANGKRTQPDGDFVLYWMQSTQRLDENWALRYATLEADRLGRPLLIHHEPDPAAPHACDRFHLFILQGARDIARDAARLGLAYQLVLRRSARARESVIDVAARAVLVVTDAFPTDGVSARTERVADAVNCRVVAVDSAGIVPVASLPREEYAARTIRPKLLKLLDLCLEPVEDRPPRRPLPHAVWQSLDVPRVELPALDDAALRGMVGWCDIDHDVAPVAQRGGSEAARARLTRFLRDGLADYEERRRHPSDEDGSSRLSPWLHHGHIAPGEVARAVLAHGPAAQAESFLNEMLVWRELALNFCWRNPAHMGMAALPTWVRDTLDRHAADPRPVTYTLETLEQAATHDPLWNAGQAELLATGQMHNVVRMLWGKSVITWAPRYEDALTWLLHLNDRYALDGRDPNSYAGIMWCFGKFDRPFAEREVWGTIRPMSLARAYRKYDVDGYLRRWSGAAQGELAIA